MFKKNAKKTFPSLMSSSHLNPNPCNFNVVFQSVQFQLRFSDAIASHSSYTCQWIGGSVSDSFKCAITSVLSHL